MKLDSEHLEILAMVVERGGLTEGAEALGKSQPSVSRTMARVAGSNRNRKTGCSKVRVFGL